MKINQNNISTEKETRAKETIGQLKEEMVNLSKLVERGAGLSLTQEAIVKELKQSKEELQSICDEQGSKIKLVEGQLIAQHQVQEEIRGEKDEAEKQKVAEKDEGGPTVEHKSNQPQNRPKNSTVE